MNIGDRVRLVANPAQSGVVIGGPRESGGRPFWHIQFGPSITWKPATQLEPAPESSMPLHQRLGRGEFGAVALFRRALIHVLVSGRLHDTFYSMEASNTDFLAYQFKPVLRILESPSRRLLVADEVGLGKTIEAGLIWTELRARADARRLVVICPKALREKWQRELGGKFGVDAQICADAVQFLDALRRPRRADMALIVGMSTLVRWRRREEDRPPRSVPGKDWEDPQNTLPAAQVARLLSASAEGADHLADLLVVDEAHHCRNPETNLHEMVRLATEACDHTVFLSATPVHNRQQDLGVLLQLLDPDTFWDHEVLEREIARNQPLIRMSRSEATVASIEAEVAQLGGDETLARRVRELISDAPSGRLGADLRARLLDELERANFLATFVVRTRKREVEMDRVVRDPVLQAVVMTPIEREYYDEVTQAVAEYARGLGASHGFLSAQPQRLMASCMTASLARFLSVSGDSPDDEESEFSSEEASEAQQSESRPLIDAIRRRIEGRWPDQTRLAQELAHPDTKFGLLIRELRKHLEGRPNAKVVLFSSFRGTVDYLGQRLSENGVRNIVVKGGHGGTDDILREFEAPDGPNVLVSTEVTSEGLDLQFCELLINYDLPWNPMRVEQRIGRLDRIGQKAERIVIWTLLHKDTIDFRIHEVLYTKLKIFSRALGDIEPIVGEQIRELTQDLLSGRLIGAKQEAERIEQTRTALETRRHQEDALEAEAPGLLGVGDLIERRIRKAKEHGRVVTDTHLRRYVMDGLHSEYTGTEFREGRDGVFEVRLADDAALDFSDFCRRQRSSILTRLTEPGVWVRCRFGNRPARRRNLGEEVISQFHPITRFVADRMQRQQQQGELYTTAAVRLRGVSEVPPGTYVLVAQLDEFPGEPAEVRLSQAVASIGDVQLSQSQAQQLVAEVVASGEDWYGWRETTDLSGAGKVAERLFLDLASGSERARQDLQARHEHRIHAQLEAISRAEARERRQAAEIAARHRAEGREALARATEGRLRKVLARLERRRRRAENLRRSDSAESAEVAIALIRVESTCGRESR